MGRRKNRIGRLHKNYEKKRQALKQNPPGRPPKRKMKKNNPPLQTPQPGPANTSSTDSLTLEEIKRVALPSSAWSTQLPSSSDHLLIFVKLQEQLSSAQPLAISHTVKIHSNFTWTITVHGHLVAQEQCSALFNLLVIASINDLAQLLVQVDQLRVCPGHPDPHFVAMANARKGKFTSSSGDTTAYMDTNCAVELNGQMYTETVRSSKCHLLIRGTKCSECVAYRDTLRSIHHRWSKKQNQSPSKVTSTHSHVNERWLNTPQRKEKVSRLKSRMRATEKRMKYMEEKIKESTERKGVQVDDPLHVGLSQIMSDYTREVQKKYEEGSFHRLFWDQQTENVSRYPTQRRWHPMLIRWCLHLKMISSSAYDVLRGILTLPCGRTLQDYTHFIKAGVGIQTEVTKQLMTEAKIDTLEESRKYVAVVFDEVKIKEGIVYDKNECVIVGFTDLGNVNNILQEFEETINDSNTQCNVAKQMLVFMVRGIFIKLRFPYAQYPTQGITADYLFPLAWEVVKHLECAGFKVISLTGDKASPNRKFFRLHQLASGQKSGVVYKVLNPYYSIEKRFLYFISDVPHLVKTARNCWSNSFSHSLKRALWFNGHHISWEHLRRLYNRQSTSGLSLVPKLTLEHINLNSYSRMRVNLAAQVLSKSVADAFKYYNESDTTETQRFVRMFDRFFDMLNTRCLEEGIQKRKPDLAPYRTPDDSRLKWLEMEFLGYLSEWDGSIKGRTGFTDAERKRMRLSDETLEGLRVTVKSFVEMARFLLQQPGVKFLFSERFCQDPLEAFFGHQRAKGGRNDSPTVQQFCKTTVSLRVQSSAALDPLRGNCRKRPTCKAIQVDNTPLPKRKCIRKS